MIKDPKILVFIPAYRCEKQITRVIDQIGEQLQKHIDTVMVVNNRSPDSTLQSAIDAGKENLTLCNFIAWTNDNNYGLGGSHKAAFGYALDNNFDYLIVLHGDDQADIRDFISLLDNKSYTNYDCVLGARFMPTSKLVGYSWFRTLGNRVYNLIFSLVARRRIYDLGSGLNMYRLSAFKSFYFKKFPDDLTFNYAMLLASYYKKQSIQFLPISWREEDQISNVKLFSQAFKVLGILCSYFLAKKSFMEKEMRLTQFEKYTGTIMFKKDVANDV
jgi:glycosyltransferase involved in cell wall biosynthesis